MMICGMTTVFWLAFTFPSGFSWTSDEEGRAPLAAAFFPGGLSAGRVGGSSGSGERLSVDLPLVLAPGGPRARAASPVRSQR